jgi:hypothetical protein
MIPVLPLAAAAAKTSIVKTLLYALWVGLRWPLGMFLGWIFLKASLAPIARAIARVLHR